VNKASQIDRPRYTVPGTAGQVLEEPIEAQPARRKEFERKIPS
jgi:hypothetical protein